MYGNKLIISTLLCLILSATVSTGAQANKEGIGREQAIAIVKDQVPGKVLKVQLKESGKASFYRVKLLTESGRVKVVRVDRRTGQLLGGPKP